MCNFRRYWNSISTDQSIFSTDVKSQLNGDLQKVWSNRSYSLILWFSHSEKLSVLCRTRTLCMTLIYLCMFIQWWFFLSDFDKFDMMDVQICISVIHFHSRYKCNEPLTQFEPVNRCLSIHTLLLSDLTFYNVRAQEYWTLAMFAVSFVQ